MRPKPELHSRERRAGRLRGLAPALLVGGLAALIVCGLPWSCPLLALTGYPCPSCGLTRAVRLGLRGDLAAATRMHPLWFLIVPACAALEAGEVWGYWTRGAWGAAIEHCWTRRVAAVLGAAMIAVWLARFAGAFGGPVR